MYRTLMRDYISPEIQWKTVAVETGFAVSDDYSLEDVDEREGEW